MSYIVTLDTFSILVHFKLIHNKVMANEILFEMNLADFVTERKLLSCFS